MLTAVPAARLLRPVHTVGWSSFLTVEVEATWSRHVQVGASAKLPRRPTGLAGFSMRGVRMVVDWLAELWPSIDHELDAMERHHGTLSEALATLFRTESTPGKAAFAVTAAAGCVWLVVHIVTFEYSAKGSHARATPR